MLILKDIRTYDDQKITRCIGCVLMVYMYLLVTSIHWNRSFYKKKKSFVSWNYYIFCEIKKLNTSWTLNNLYRTIFLSFYSQPIRKMTFQIFLKLTIIVTLSYCYYYLSDFNLTFLIVLKKKSFFIVNIANCLSTFTLFYYNKVIS